MQWHRVNSRVRPGLPPDSGGSRLLIRSSRGDMRHPNRLQIQRHGSVAPAGSSYPVVGSSPGRLAAARSTGSGTGEGQTLKKLHIPCRALHLAGVDPDRGCTPSSCRGSARTSPRRPLTRRTERGALGKVLFAAAVELNSSRVLGAPDWALSRMPAPRACGSSCSPTSYPAVASSVTVGRLPKGHPWATHPQGDLRQRLGSTGA